MFITFVDDVQNRKWTYDGVVLIKIKNDMVRIKCEDGFGTTVMPDEYTDVRLEK